MSIETTTLCSECWSEHAKSDLVNIDGKMICGACKERHLQRLHEGVPNPNIDFRRRSGITPRFTQLIALLQIVGGLCSLGIAAMMLQTQFTKSIWFLLAILVSVSLVAIYAGVELLRSRNRGYFLSIPIQLIQIPIVSSSLVVYRLFLGLQVSVGMFGSNIGLNFNLGGQLDFLLFDSPAITGFGVNLVPCWALYHLIRNRRKRN